MCQRSSALQRPRRAAVSRGRNPVGLWLQVLGAGEWFISGNEAFSFCLMVFLSPSERGPHHPLLLAAFPTPQVCFLHPKSILSG